MAALHARPADVVRGRARAGPGSLDRRSDSDHRQNAAAVSAVLAVGPADRARMEDRGSGPRRFVQPRDYVALARRPRVVGRRKNDGHGRVAGRRQHPPVNTQLARGTGKVTLRRAVEERPERHRQPRQQRLNLGIAEPGVALDQDRTLRREHQAGIQRAAERGVATGSGRSGTGL